MTETSIHPERKILINRMVEASIDVRRLLKVNKKKKAFEKGWPDKLYTPSELANYPRWAICGSPPFVLVDPDTEEAEDELSARLPVTFEVKSAIKGRAHRYYKVTGGIIPNKILFSPTTGKPCGEVRSNNYYCVTVGSEVEGVDPETGEKITGTYTILNDRPIAEVSFADFMEAITPFLGSNPEQKLTFNDIREGVEEGRRQVTAVQYAAFLINVKGFDRETTLHELKRWDHELNHPPMYEDSELERIVNYCFQHRTYQSQNNTSSKEHIANESHLQILQDPELFDRITEREFDKKIVGEIDTRKTTFLCACGRLVANHNIASFNLMVNSESGAGKDWVVDNVLSILPKDEYVKRTRITPTLFNYWHNPLYEPEWTWEKKVFYNEDTSNSVLNSEVFKVMASSGSFATVVIKQRAHDIEIRGKPVMIITCSDVAPNKESLRRFPLLTLDESTDQTQAIQKRQAKMAIDGMIDEYDNEIRDALSCLKRVKVRIPFADRLVDLFPNENLLLRTHFQRFLDLIKASTAFHQFQREIDDEGYYLANIQDYDIARTALLKITNNPKMIPLTKKHQRVLEVFERLDIGKLEPGRYSTSDIAQFVSFWSEKWLKTQLDKLTDDGFLEKSKEKREESKKEVMVYRQIEPLSGFDIPFGKDINFTSIDSNHSINYFNSIDSIKEDKGDSTSKPQKTPKNTKEEQSNESNESNRELTNIIDQEKLMRCIQETKHGDPKWRDINLQIRHIGDFSNDVMRHPNLVNAKFDDMPRLMAAVTRFIKATPTQKEVKTTVDQH